MRGPPLTNTSWEPTHLQVKLGNRRNSLLNEQRKRKVLDPRNPNMSASYFLYCISINHNPMVSGASIRDCWVTLLHRILRVRVVATWMDIVVNLYEIILCLKLIPTQFINIFLHCNHKSFDCPRTSDTQGILYLNRHCLKTIQYLTYGDNHPDGHELPTQKYSNEKRTHLAEKIKNKKQGQYNKKMTRPK